MIQPAQRINTVQEYYFSIKLKQIDKMREEGKDVINLGIGNPDFPPSPVVIDTLCNSATNASNHGYQGYIGIPSLRKAFADWYLKFYGVTIDPTTEILPLMGSKEGIMHVSMAFLNPGDEVLVPNPGYPTYSSVAALVGAKVRYYNLSSDNGWQPRLDEIAREDLSKVKLMWVNYPHMPTGATAREDTYKALIAFGRKNDIVICNDNPYSFVLNPNPSSLLAIKGASEVAIELNSLSKSHNMAGWRVGMAASNPQFINYILRVKSNMDSGMFKPLQEAAAKALMLDQSWFNDMNDLYAQRREVVWQIMNQLECSYDKNQVGMFIWAKVPSKAISGEALSDSVLESTNVFVTPGLIFGSNGEQYIRISLCTPVERLNQALERIKNAKI